MKWLFIHAFFLSAKVKLTLRLLPYRFRLYWMGDMNTETEITEIDLFQQQRTMVKEAMVWCKIYTPWHIECYTMAVTAKILLREMGLSSTLYIGFRKNQDKRIEGHAWLRSGNLMITGGDIANLFTVNSFYS